MELIVFRLALDFGLAVLIWVVQLLIYPSFLHYSPENLQQWHLRYTSRMAIIVIPLMFGQLAITIYQAFCFPNVYTLGSITVLVVIWVVTFIQFVPMHKTITNTTPSRALLENLIKRNRLRTFLWSLLFLWSLTEFLLRGGIGFTSVQF